MSRDFSKSSRWIRITGSVRKKYKYWDHTLGLVNQNLWKWNQECVVSISLFFISLWESAPPEVQLRYTRKFGNHWLRGQWVLKKTESWIWLQIVIVAKVHCLVLSNVCPKVITMLERECVWPSIIHHLVGKISQSSKQPINKQTNQQTTPCLFFTNGGRVVWSRCKNPWLSLLVNFP